MNSNTAHGYLKIPFNELEIYILSDGYFDIGSYQPIIATDRNSKMAVMENNKNFALVIWGQVMNNEEKFRIIRKTFTLDFIRKMKMLYTVSIIKLKMNHI